MDQLHHGIWTRLPSASSARTWLSTAEVHEMFQQVSRRQISRKLQELEEEGLATSRRVKRELQWQRQGSLAGLAAKQQTMLPWEALALQLMSRFAANKLPPAVRDDLQPVFKAADYTLQQHSQHQPQFNEWSAKVATVPGGFALKEPEVNKAIYSSVTEALFYEQQLQLQYRPNGWSDDEKQPANRTVWPLGLVESDGLLYLVAARPDKDEPAMYRLDRIVQAQCMSERFNYPSKFSLQRFIEVEREFDLFPKGRITLELVFREDSANHLKNRIIGEDQTSEARADGLYVKATVMRSKKLKWWLRTFGYKVEVLAPADLRDELARDAMAVASVYGKVTTGHAAEN